MPAALRGQRRGGGIIPLKAKESTRVLRESVTEIGVSVRRGAQCLVALLDSWRDAESASPVTVATGAKQ